MSERPRLLTSRRHLLAGGAALLIVAPAWTKAFARGKSDDRRLAAQLADIRSVREIKRLQHMWGHLADAGQWRAMAALFTADGLWTDGSRQVSGRDAITAFLRQDMGGGQDDPQPGRLNLRFFLSPVITLAADGRSGTGRWHEVAMTGEAGQRADRAGGIHVVDYALTAEGWRIARMHYHPQFSGPYADGWRSVAQTVPLVPFHYTPDQAGAPVPLAREAAAALPGPALRAQADQLLAGSAAQNLQAAFGYYLDRKLYDDIVDLFADDGVVDIAGVGRFSGKAGVRRMLARFGAAGLATGEVNDRPQLMPVVTVDATGRQASVRSYELGMTGHHQGTSFWSAAINRFTVKQGADGIWRIAALERWPRMRAAYEAGWANPLPAPLPEGVDGAADAASSLPLAAYPQAAVPAPAFTASLAPAPNFAGSGDGAAKLAQALTFDGAENVCNAYGYYIDEFLWDETADLFSTNGWKELSYIGTFIGRERIRQSMVNRYGRGGRKSAAMQFHQKTQPYVTVTKDGQRANIRLRLLQFGSSPTSPGSWISGIYENQVIREEGIWKIQGMDLDYVWLANYKGGWSGIVAGSSKIYAPTPEVIAKFPPDAPLRGVVFPPFPDIAPMGFHFLNPVSGRRPQTFLPWSDGRRAPANDRGGA
jgi:hypothetical protein